MKEDESSIKRLKKIYKKKQKIYMIKNAAIISTLLSGTSIVNFITKRCSYIRDLLKFFC